MSTDLRLKQALAAMWFAYVNKDEVCPHAFEEYAVQEAEQILGPWEKAMSKYLLRDESDIWEDVETNPPDPGERVLVSDSDGLFVCEAYLHQDGRWMRCGLELSIMEPKYWRYMPLGPKAKKDSDL